MDTTKARASSVEQTGTSLQLLCHCGSYGHFYYTHQFVLYNCIQLYNYEGDETKKKLYTNMYLFVLDSVYKGDGLGLVRTVSETSGEARRLRQEQLDRQESY